MRQLPPFWRHVATVLGGALGAQALPLLAAPLLTRMCTPQEMGAYSVWLGVIALSAIGATLRMEAAMILDHEQAHQRTCFRVVFYSATVAALLLTLLATAVRLAGFAPALHLPWAALLTIGAGAWLTACMQTTLAYATSHNAFGKAARAKVSKLLETMESLPVLPREIEDILTISTTERRRWLEDGRLPSGGIRTVRLRGRAKRITFHVFEPKVVEELLNNGAIDEWREHDLAAKAENRRRAAHQAKLTRSLKKAKSARPPERSSAELSGWEEFDRDGLLR